MSKWWITDGHTTEGKLLWSIWWVLAVVSVSILTFLMATGAGLALAYANIGALIFVSAHMLRSNI